MRNLFEQTYFRFPPRLNTDIAQLAEITVFKMF